MDFHEEAAIDRQKRQRKAPWVPLREIPIGQKFLTDRGVCMTRVALQYSDDTYAMFSDSFLVRKMDPEDKTQPRVP